MSEENNGYSYSVEQKKDNQDINSFWKFQEENVEWNELHDSQLVEWLKLTNIYRKAHYLSSLVYASKQKKLYIASIGLSASFTALSAFLIDPSIVQEDESSFTIKAILCVLGAASTATSGALAGLGYGKKLVKHKSSSDSFFDISTDIKLLQAIPKERRSDSTKVLTTIKSQIGSLMVSSPPIPEKICIKTGITQEFGEVVSNLSLENIPIFPKNNTNTFTNKVVQEMEASRIDSLSQNQTTNSLSQSRVNSLSQNQTMNNNDEILNYTKIPNNALTTVQQPHIYSFSQLYNKVPTFAQPAAFLQKNKYSPPLPPVYRSHVVYPVDKNEKKNTSPLKYDKQSQSFYREYNV